jgi:hypothetical protein
MLLSRWHDWSKSPQRFSDQEREIVKILQRKERLLAAADRLVRISIWKLSIAEEHC